MVKQVFSKIFQIVLAIYLVTPIAYGDPQESKEYSYTESSVPVEERPVPSVCDRSPGVRSWIINNFAFARCGQITKTMLAEVREIKMEFPKMTEIREGDFNDFSNLKELIITFSSLSRIEAGAFRDLKELETLHLIGNELSVLPKEVFWPLVSLRELSLSNNEIESLDPEAFAKCLNLQKFWFSRNKNFKLLDGRLFRGLIHLNTLYLEAINLGSVDSNFFFGLEELEVLSLSDNPIDESIFSKIAHLKNLRVLSLANTELTQLSKNHLKPLVSLVSLEIGGSNFDLIDEDAFVGLNILKVDVMGSPLRQTSRAAFSGVETVRGLPANFGIAEDVGGGTWD